MTTLEVAEAFVEAINSSDVNHMTGLMTSNHMFVDADGSEHVGKDQMSLGWQNYFALVPDFQIEIIDRFEREDTVVLLGWASGTIMQKGELKPKNQWRVPAAWRVVIESDHVAVWQLYTNQHEMHEILKRINAD
ncbi:MAG: nuclear transport factor 2 family protein [bacterium]|nr:MAG: nuclear transport factor 2 family protein [bacterium]